MRELLDIANRWRIDELDLRKAGSNAAADLLSAAISGLMQAIETRELAMEIAQRECKAVQP